MSDKWNTKSRPPPNEYLATEIVDEGNNRTHYPVVNLNPECPIVKRFIALMDKLELESKNDTAKCD